MRPTASYDIELLSTECTDPKRTEIAMRSTIETLLKRNKNLTAQKPKIIRKIEYSISWNIITKSGEWKWKYLTADDNDTTMELCFRHGSAVGFNLLKHHQFLWTENFGSKLLAFYNGSNWKMKMEKLPVWNGTTQQWKKSFTTCSYHIGCCVIDIFSGDILLPISYRCVCHECFKPLQKIHQFPWTEKFVHNLLTLYNLGNSYQVPHPHCTTHWYMCCSQVRHCNTLLQWQVDS